MDVSGAGSERAPLSWRAPALRTRVCVLVVVAACAIVYASALWNEFVFDDVQLVKDNDAIRSVASIPEIFAGNLWGVLGKTSNYYRPGPPLLYMGVYALVGLAPWAFHLLNVVLHAGASVLVFLIASRLLCRPAGGGAHVVPALLAALVFAAHPLHTEAVTWIAGIMDVSCTFFALLSFYGFLRADDAPPPGGARILSLVSFFLATLCKEPALLLPPLILACDYLRRSPADRSFGLSVKHSLPYLAVVGVYLAMRAHALRGLAPLTRGETDLGLYETVINIPPLFALYLGKLAVPLRQNVLYHVPPVTSLAEPRALVGWLVVIGFVAAALWAARRSQTLFLSLAFLALPLAPALYLPALTQKPVNAFAERYAYFASVGFALLVGASLLWLGSRSRKAYAGAVGVLTIVIVVFAVLTVQRNAVWRDNLTLWSDSVTKSPGSAFAHANLGYALFYAGRPAEGARELRTALGLDPEIPHSIVATGIAYSKKGLLTKAVLEFSVALMFDPDMVDAHYNLGLALQEKGWLDAAIAHYEKALAIDPRLQAAHVNLGIAWAEKGDLDKAIVHFRAAVDLAPDDRAARHNLARAYAAKGLREQAAEQRSIAETLDDAGARGRSGVIPR
jgi:tetratricopeptide (TPR) repeat protein